MKKNRYWFKIDTAGRVFPSISNMNQSNVFRLSMTLTEPIDETILETSINEVLPRFETFSVTLKTGLFWQYLEASTSKFKVSQETAILTEYIKPTPHHDYLFKVYYYESTITLEVFHAISDGKGTFEFLKAIVYKYLVLKGRLKPNVIPYLNDSRNHPKYNEDAFIKNFDKGKAKRLKEEKAFHLKGPLFKHHFSHLMTVDLPLLDLKKAARSYEASITEYLSAILIHALTFEASFKNQKKPIKLFVPINLRPYFDSKSLRNFSLFIKASVKPSQKPLDFKDILKIVQKDFKQEKEKEGLISKISSYVHLEDKAIVRLSPFFIKKIAFKIGYKKFGKQIMTSAFSNYGIADIDEAMLPFVKNVNFLISAQGLSFSAISYQNVLRLNIISRFKHLPYTNQVIKQCVSHGFKPSVSSNWKEGYDELL